jgi:ADP-ribosylglycohydrolase
MPSSALPADRRARIRASALWAAYGDALGFVGELARNASQVRRRAGVYPVDRTRPWRRRVGGRGGPTLALPAGCVSDDTQLRLAVCRSIRGDGRFDAEVFSKIELTIWPAYALGAGRGSQVAAANLRRRDVSWSTNFFEADRAVYVAGGGNGAAMRVQPHVWAAPRGAFVDRVLPDAIADAVCTHGHLRGILGAAFHAWCLQFALESETLPGPGEWRRAVDELEAVVDVVQQHDELGHLWLAMWQARTGETLAAAVAQVQRELREDIRRIAPRAARIQTIDYEGAAQAIGAGHPAERGSGTKTALLGALVAWQLGDDPALAVRTAANALGTDTDSIATMAGALLGAAEPAELPGEVADRSYIEFEADRMWMISEGMRAPTFRYPELRRWSAPRAHADVLGLHEDGLALMGLGPCEPTGELHATSGEKEIAWQWVDVWFGQRVLIKRRARPPRLSESEFVAPTEHYSPTSLLDELDRAVGAQAAPPHVARRPGNTLGAVQAPPSLHELTNEAIAADFDEALVGRRVRAMLEEQDGIERAIAYVAIVGKALASRRDRDRRVSGR